MSDVTNSVAWQALDKHKQQFGRTHLRQLFADDPQRAKTMSLQAGDWYLDYSKNLATSETVDLLLDLAQSRKGLISYSCNIGISPDQRSWQRVNRL